MLSLKLNRKKIYTPTKTWEIIKTVKLNWQQFFKKRLIILITIDGFIIKWYYGINHHNDQNKESLWKWMDGWMDEWVWLIPKLKLKTF